ncbi:SDR family NAD(P)-dependent oxidoreductase [Spirosoma sp.]|uniref:SDR family NAD(P)-dependent oxidoreductase n=1 Tax=Spirosoma sp. TaxID=1899569 RepID=UPI003B3AEF89
MINGVISILGCGWLGLPLAEHLLTQGYQVKGSATSDEKVGLLKAKGIDAYMLLLNPEPDGNLASLLQADTLIINIPPRARKQGNEFHPKQISSLVESIQKSQLKHVIYVSTTSVYPDLNRIVVEEDVVTPAQSAAPALLEAENLILSLAPNRVVTVLRLGGLLGYERIPGKYVAGRTVDTGDEPVNYIHRDDALRVLTATVQQTPAGTFNVVAPNHPAREAIYRKNSADFGFQLPTLVAPIAPVPYKIVSADKLSQTLNYSFQYPDPLQFYYQL